MANAPAPQQTAIGLEALIQRQYEQQVGKQGGPENEDEEEGEEQDEQDVGQQLGPQGGQQRVQIGRHRAVRTPPTQKAPDQQEPLPLAKKNGSSQNSEAMQQDSQAGKNDDSFVGSSKGNSQRGNEVTQNLGGSQGANGQVSNGNPGDQPVPDLDRLARAILPEVKRMLAIERDRRAPRMKF
jgi:hypothetical protein